MIGDPVPRVDDEQVCSRPARQTVRFVVAEGSTEGVVPGESIAVNGVCLTVTGILDGTFTADVMGETLNRSGLGALGPGAPVNLERFGPSRTGVRRDPAPTRLLATANA